MTERVKRQSEGEGSRVTLRRTPQSAGGLGKSQEDVLVTRRSCMALPVQGMRNMEPRRKKANFTLVISVIQTVEMLRGPLKTILNFSSVGSQAFQQLYVVSLHLFRKIQHVRIYHVEQISEL